MGLAPCVGCPWGLGAKAGAQRRDELFRKSTLLVAATSAAAHGGSFGTGDPYEPGDWLGLILALNGEAFHALVGPSGLLPLNDDPCSH